MTAQRLDDAGWLAARYQVATGVEIAAELEVSSRAVYAAMDRHGITRRAHPSIVKLRRPELTDDDWLHRAVEHRSSTSVASDLGVSAGTVTAAYRDAGIDPASTTKLYARGRPLNRPSPETLQAVWPTQRSYRAVGSRFGIAHSTAAVWLAEAGIFADPIPKLSRRDLLNAIGIGWPLTRIAAEHGVSVTAVRIELHRHNLFEAHRTRHHAPHR